MFSAIIIGGILLFIISFIVLIHSIFDYKNLVKKTINYAENIENQKIFLQQQYENNLEKINIFEQYLLDQQYQGLPEKEQKQRFCQGKRALIGDYMYESSNITEKILNKFGFIVDVVESGEEIVNRIKHGYKCDIIFTNNQYMHGINGPDVLEQLKELKDFDIPVVILTIEKNDDHKFDEFDYYIRKPLDEKQAKPILKKIFNGR